MAVAEPDRLHVSNRSVAVAVLIVGVAVGVLRLFEASTRVLGWVAVAAIGAGLLRPLVARAGRRMPHGLAVAVVFVGALASIGFIVYAGVDDVRRQADALKEEAPKAARDLERSDRYGSAARDFHLEERTRQFVDQLPERLRGGDTASALRAAATRGVAFLATLVLTLFLLVHGPRLVERGLAQIRDEERRSRVNDVMLGAYARSVRYVAFTLARVLVAGFFAEQLARAVDIPGSTVLGIAVALMAVIPLFGVLVGALPLILMTAAFHPGRLVLVASAVVLYQVAEVLLVQRRIEQQSIHIGPVLTLVTAMAGFELYGLGGAIVGVVLVVLAVSVLVELAPSDESELLRAADEILPGDVTDGAL
jgi:predicted PurR-regulated permease PerM